MQCLQKTFDVFLFDFALTHIRFYFHLIFFGLIYIFVLLGVLLAGVDWPNNK